MYAYRLTKRSGDPHPGNVLVRSHPKNKNDVQVVIIDHGLYIQESEKYVQ